MRASFALAALVLSACTTFPGAELLDAQRCLEVAGRIEASHPALAARIRASVS